MAYDKTFKPVVSFVVPVYNQADKTIKCFASIRDRISTPYEIIWVDNASNDDEYIAIRKQATRPRVHTKLVRMPSNQGFVKATNAGIAEAVGEYVILLNNDTEVGNEMAAKLIKPFELDKKRKIGGVGPVTQSRIGWQGMDALNNIWKLGLPLYDKDQILYAKTIEHTFAGKCIDVGKYPLSFFCCCLRRSTFKELGVLDENFGIGIGDDDEYNMRLRAHGYTQLLALDAFCMHHHRTTFKALRIGIDSIRRYNVKLLKKKSIEYGILETQRLQKQKP